ncbi:MAG: carbohydrate kinase family protein [Anaerolineae bacterium]|nr:carbohydrate kinase family protein [Anaerolineae bacterium]
MKIICSGSIAYDYLMTFPGYFKDHIIPERLESISLSFLVDSMVRQRGGVSPNIAYTLALLGEKPYLMGTVGEDFGDYRVWLEEQGINCSLVKTIPGVFTASFFANTDLSNNQISSFYAGAMAHAADHSLNVLTEKPDLVIISPNDPTAMDNYVRECQEKGYDYLYDPSQQVIRLDGEQLKHGVMGAKYLFVNEYEFELIQKRTGLTPDQICKTVEVLVVTLGEKGSAIYSKGKTYNVAVVKPEKIEDPTGVGDAYRGGFIKGMCMGVDLQTCGQMGAVAAAYCLERRGTQCHNYTKAEFVKRYQQNFGDQSALNALLK